VQPELYWVILDRARTAAELSDDPVMLAGAAWISGNGLRTSGYADEALRIVTKAALSLQPKLTSGTDRLRGMYGALCLHAAVTFAQESREGDAWRWWDNAERVAKSMPGYIHPWTAFGVGNVNVHAVTIGVELKTPGIAAQSVEKVDPATVLSVERQSRLFVDAARASWARKEAPATLHYLGKAFGVSPEGVRYAPAARALAYELVTIKGPLQADAQRLAEEIGLAI
jgi:hypothetical protein